MRAKNGADATHRHPTHIYKAGIEATCDGGSAYSYRDGDEGGGGGGGECQGCSQTLTMRYKTEGAGGRDTLMGLVVCACVLAADLSSRTAEGCCTDTRHPLQRVLLARTLRNRCSMRWSGCRCRCKGRVQKGGGQHRELGDSEDGCIVSMGGTHTGGSTSSGFVYERTGKGREGGRERDRGGGETVACLVAVFGIH